jgi:hypothetical protein
MGTSSATGRTLHLVDIENIFAGRSLTMTEAGLAVEVVSRPDGCSRRLQCFACSFLAPNRNDVVLAA